MRKDRKPKDFADYRDFKVKLDRSFSYPLLYISIKETSMAWGCVKDLGEYLIRWAAWAEKRKTR
jgi:hypothetical protein